MEIHAMNIIFHEATIDDIQQIQVVRNAVLENQLSDPLLITDKDCEEYVLHRGKGWVCEVAGKIVGFSIVDLQENNVWALFVHPAFDKRGIGSQLHDIMVDWYFSQTTKGIWLGTAPGTRAERFYRTKGWTETGKHRKKEIKFEMSYQDWWKRKTSKS
jgi:GNAT superfamily N-acetyltransferase